MQISFFLVCLFCLFNFCAVFAGNFSPKQLVTTESDPDAFVQECVNVINGDYCESGTDLVIEGPDPLILQRFYSSKNYLTGKESGGWRFLTQRFLIVGQDFTKETSKIGNETCTKFYAFTGERTGGIFAYSGWKNRAGEFKEPFKIDSEKDAIGSVNTYAKEINGKLDHQNNVLKYAANTCELIVGDGTRRIYKKVSKLPSLFMGEELTRTIAEQVLNAEFFILIEERLPSGNRIFYSYNSDRRLIAVELKNKEKTKVLSWINLKYEIEKKNAVVNVSTSDEKTLTYKFDNKNDIYQLVDVKGSHLKHINYRYEKNSLKKSIKNGLFLLVEYQDGKVHCLKTPHHMNGEATISRQFEYGLNYTDVYNNQKVKVRFNYDARFQLTAIEYYDENEQLYRNDRKFWGATGKNRGRILAKTIADGTGKIHSYRSFIYDDAGNVKEEKLYGKLTGKNEVSLQVNPDGILLAGENQECSIKVHSYTSDGFNMPATMGDCKGNQIQYFYKPSCNLLDHKFIYSKGIVKRTYYYYNEDGVCFKMIEDDGNKPEDSNLSGVTERHITNIFPKELLLGIGFLESIETKTLDINQNCEILIKKNVNKYDKQGHLLSCETYGSDNKYAYTEAIDYNSLGQKTVITDAAGRIQSYTYDKGGNQKTISTSHTNNLITTDYNYHNLPIKVVTETPEDCHGIQFAYDNLGRKTSSTDRYGNLTYFEYDAFDRLKKVVHPETLDENNQLITPTFEYFYDVFGNVIRILDPQGFATLKTYNLRGDPTKIDYPDGTSEYFKYDLEGSLHRSVTREQIVTVHEYDYLGRKTYEESTGRDLLGSKYCLSGHAYEYNGFQCRRERFQNYIKEIQHHPADRITTILEKDRLNVTDPRKTELTYDPLGRISQKKVFFGNGSENYALESFEYDILGNVLRKKVQNAAREILLEKEFLYDLSGRCLEEYGFENGTKITLFKTTYNAAGDPIIYENAGGEKTFTEINHCWQNNLGQTVLKKTMTNPNNVTTEIEFDTLNRFHSLVKKDASGATLSSEKLFYDALGNKTRAIYDQIQDGKAIDSKAMCWKYGPMGQLLEEVEAEGSSLERKTIHTYNIIGKLASKTLVGTGIHFIYHYNEKGLVSKIEGFKAGKLESSNEYLYDSYGNITDGKTLSGVSVNREFNIFKELTKETVKDSWWSYNLKYDYDGKGRLKEITLPDYAKIAYSYDAAFGRAVTAYSPRGDFLYTHTYDTYDSLGRLAEETFIQNGGTQKHRYNLDGREVLRENTFFKEEYKRDSLERITEIYSQQVTKNYSYNDLSQLTSETGHENRAYAYDSSDNQIRVNSEDRTHNALNQLTSASFTEFQYDALGNLQSKSIHGEQLLFENDVFSQMICFKKSDEIEIKFVYDAFGRLLAEEYINPKEKSSFRRTQLVARYFYFGHQEMGSLTERNEMVKLKIFGLAGEEISPFSVAFEFKGVPYLPLHDITGNVKSLHNPKTKEMVEEYHYTAFGNEKIINALGDEISPSFAKNPWRFAEKRFNDKTGLISFGFRFYDPSICRWISPDPLGFVDGQNVYAYVHNNPVTNYDRYGLYAENFDKSLISEIFGEYERHCFCETHRDCKRGGEIGITNKSYLPKVVHCTTFEKFYKDYRSEDLFIEDYYENSRNYDLSDLGALQLPNALGIGFINGINNSYADSKESAQYLSQLSGGYNIHGVYNATHGAHRDILECMLGLNFIATEPVRQLHVMWNSFFDKSRETNFLMICHSQGAIHVRNALLDYPQELRERILVVAIAPGGYIYQESCKSVTHYRVPFPGDFVPDLDFSGAKRAQNSIALLSSHPDAPLWDHSFMSPTYTKTLKNRINKYLRDGGLK